MRTCEKDQNEDQNDLGARNVVSVKVAPVSHPPVSQLHLSEDINRCDKYISVPKFPGTNPISAAAPTNVAEEVSTYTLCAHLRRVFNHP